MDILKRLKSGEPLSAVLEDLINDITSVIAAHKSSIDERYARLLDRVENLETRVTKENGTLKGRCTIMEKKWESLEETDD